MKEKPELEYFFNVLYKGFCGHCGRILFTGGDLVDNLKKTITSCKYCNYQVDWNI